MNNVTWIIDGGCGNKPTEMYCLKAGDSYPRKATTKISSYGRIARY